MALSNVNSVLFFIVSYSSSLYAIASFFAIDSSSACNLNVSSLSPDFIFFNKASNPVIDDSTFLAFNFLFNMLFFLSMNSFSFISPIFLFKINSIPSFELQIFASSFLIKFTDFIIRG